MCIRLMLVAMLGLTIIGAGLLATSPAPQATPTTTFRGPVAIVTSPDGARAYVACLDSHEIAVIELREARVSGIIPLPGPPSGLALTSDGTTLYATCCEPRGQVAVIDLAAMRVAETIPGGHSCTGPALSPDGERLYVCNRFSTDMSVIDTRTRRETGRIPVNREPVAAAWTPDATTVFVANLLPAGPANGESVAAAITAVDVASATTTQIALPAGASGVKGLCVSPDGAQVYVCHLLARYNLPTTQLDRGWMNTNVLSVIDARSKKWINTVLLDEVDLGAPNPTGLALTPDGKQICVTLAGADELMIIDAQGLLSKLAAAASSSETETLEVGKDDSTVAPHVTSRPQVRDDLSFLGGLRKRIKLAGQGPRGVAVAGDQVLVTEYFSGTISMVSLIEPAHRRQTPLGPQAPLTAARRGERLFHDAGLCFQQWQSCASCHPDGRVDGFNWDLMNDGMGNPKNTLSLLLAHQTPPSMTLGVRETSQAAVRSGLQHILFTTRPESEAADIDAYLEALTPVPGAVSSEPKLAEAVHRGRLLFEDAKIGCAKCHPAPLFTDRKRYDVRSAGPYDSAGEFDTPTLIECWRTAPYLHDGSVTTIRQLLELGHGSTAGAVDQLTPQQIDDLAAYVLSL